jgi:hypothetical protein
MQASTGFFITRSDDDYLEKTLMKRDSRAPLIIAIVLLLLPVFYMGSYLALVEPGADLARRVAVAGGALSSWWPIRRARLLAAGAD